MGEGAHFSNFLLVLMLKHWKDPLDDDRRTVAENQMTSFNNTDVLTMFATLSTYPVQNPETAFTSFMSSSSSPSHPRMKCFLRQPITLKPSGEY